MLLILFFLLIFLLILLLFASPKLSPVPYYPTNKKDLSLIIKALKLKNNQTVFDFGAGDGLVIFAAAKKSLEKKFNTQFVAVEINPVLVIILYLRRLFHPNKKNIKILKADFFKLNLIDLISLKNLTTIYLYISPWLIDKLIKNLKLKTENYTLVSYMYSSKLLRSKEKIIKGHHNIYVYN